MHCFIGLGSNLGNREENLTQAFTGLQSRKISINKVSSLYETEPVGAPGQPLFLNMAAEINTSLKPPGLLAVLKAIEHQLGRTPSLFHHPRPIDLDILLAGDMIVSRPGLIIPHPRMHERLFVLIPLNEIAPDAVHPVFKKSIKNLKQNCRDKGFVRKYGILDFFPAD
ncbi:MAG: 2-amino-4-hydroxy-6-hydroxymethyldihydropteridine diphosphokinase [Candidatus Aminicenantes bacterium]